jgi:hypothetical protein
LVDFVNKKNVMKIKKVKYNGNINPYRKNSKEYNEYYLQRDWWMNNLDLNIIRDYLLNLNYKISELKFQNDLLHKYKMNVEDKEFQ